MNLILMSLLSLFFLVSCFGPGDEYNPMGGLSNSRVLSSSKTLGGIYFDYSIDQLGCNVTLREQSMQRLPMRLDSASDALFCNGRAMTEYRDVFGNYRYESKQLGAPIRGRYLITFTRNGTRYDSYVNDFTVPTLIEPVQGDKVDLDNDFVLRWGNNPVDEKRVFIYIDGFNSLDREIWSGYYLISEKDNVVVKKEYFVGKVLPHHLKVRMKFYQPGDFPSGLSGEFSMARETVFQIEVK